MINFIKYFSLIIIILFNTSSFADEIMKCKINNEQYKSFKLEKSMLFGDKIYFKKGTSWIRKCKCHKVKNKSVKCNQGEDKRCIKNKFGDLQLDNPSSWDIIIDFEVKSFQLGKSKTRNFTEFKCNLVG
jgi:hypothetical protein